MSKRAFIAFIALLSILYSFGVNAPVVQAQPPPPVPPLVFYGTASVDGTPLTAADTDHDVSVLMERLLLIFLDDLDSQATIVAIRDELDVGIKTELQDAFLNSEYCSNYVPAITLSGDAVVTVQNPGNQWQVTDSGKVYTVKRDPISIWDPGLEDWVPGHKLEVYQHNGLIVLYTMGDLPTDDYVAQIPMNSNEVFGGDIEGGDFYLLRDPGKAVVGDRLFICINDIQTADPVLPYEIVAHDDFVNLDIDAPSVYDYPVDLAAGWNLVSTPVQPQNTDLLTVLAPIDGKYDSVWRYSANPGWLWFLPSAPGSSNLHEIESSIGYWIEMTESWQLVFQGLQPSTVIHLYVGWNLVGYNLLTPRPLVDCISGIAGNFSSIWEYDPVDGWRWYLAAAPGSSNLQIMRPGKAYWIEVTTECDWDVAQ